MTVPLNIDTFNFNSPSKPVDRVVKKYNSRGINLKLNFMLRYKFRDEHD